MPVIETEVKTGEAYQIGDITLTPQTRVFTVRVPGYQAGLIWNRPRSVLVRTPDGRETSLLVPDVTRIAIWAMLAGGILGAVVIGMIFGKRHAE